MNRFFMLTTILLPFVSAILIACLGRIGKSARAWIAGAASLLTCAAAIGAAAVPGGECVLWSITESLEFSVAGGALASFFSVLLSAVWFLVSVYSSEYMEDNGHTRRFYSFFLLTLGSVMGLSLSRNLITFYMFYEFMTLLSVPLVMHEMTREAIAAGIKYLVYSVFGACAALFGIFYVGSVAGTFDFTAGGIAAIAADGNRAIAVLFVMVMGFGVKAGMFPLHSWLPTAHPVAPAPASAVLSGVITKAGVLGILRCVFYIGGADLLTGSWAQNVLLALASVTVVMGSTMALKEKLLKKRLAYSTVSQVSYVLIGIFSLTPLGLVGALLHTAAHSVIKDGLFLGAGSLIHKTGLTKVEDLRGIGKKMPVTLWTFAIASCGLIGLPPTVGFVSKWYLAEGALAMETGCAWIFPAVLLLSAVLTAAYLLPIVFRGFFPGADAAPGKMDETGWRMWLPLCVLAAAVLALGLLPNGLIGFFTSISSELF